MLSLPLLFVLLAMSSPTHEERYSCRTRAPCGCSIKWTIMAKIVGGETVTTRSWGWLVSFVHNSNQKHFCAGSILSSSWILTAAHCVFDRDASDILVNAGSNKIDQSTQKREVAKIVSHPFYDSDTFVNDIALIQLSSPLDMTDPAVAKICLPLQTAVDDASNSMDDDLYKNEYPPVDSILVAVGWGRKLEDVILPAYELQQVTLKAVAYESSTCQESIFSRAVQFCAGVEKGGKDTCQGDSGGPLMKFTSSRQWVVAGLTSFGRGCGRAEHSGVYTRVAFYLDWINTTMNAEDMLTDSVLTAHDILHRYTDETTHDIFPEESVVNICSRYYSSPLLCIVIAIGVSLYFI